MTELTKSERKATRTAIRFMRLMRMIPDTQEAKTLVKKLESETDKDKALELNTRLNAMIQEANEKKIRARVKT